MKAFYSDSCKNQRLLSGFNVNLVFSINLRFYSGIYLNCTSAAFLLLLKEQIKQV